MTALRLVRVTLAGLFGTLAGLGFGPVFGGLPGSFLTAVGSAALTATLVAAGTVLAPKVPAAAAAVVGSVAIAAVVAVVVRPGRDVLDGPLLLLTGALPADPSGPGLAAVAALTGWSVLAAGLLAARAGHPALPLLPPLGCLVAALSVGASASPLPAWYSLAAISVAAAVLATGRRVRLTAGQLAAAAVVAAIAVAGTAAIAPSAPGVGARPPADARALVAAPVQPRSGVSPLQQFPALRSGQKPVRLTGTVTRRVAQLRLVALTHFDGTYWTVRADYRRAGTTLPALPPTSAGRAEIRQTVQVERLPDSLAWLPSAGHLTSLTVAGLAVDEATGDLAVPVDREIPASYTATSAWLDVTPDQIRAGEPTRREDPLDPPLPAEVRAFADSVARDQPSGSGTLLALLNRFTATGSSFTFDISDDAPGGHGYYQITRLLEDKRGTAEQYASTYAVMARHLGFEARVVMGFRPRYEQSTTFTATAREVDAWVEVRYDGIGWVPFDPTPRGNPVGPKGNEPPPPDPEDSTAQAAEDQQRAPSAPPPNAPAAPEPPPPDDGAELTVIIIASVAVVLLVAFAIPVAKTVRRHRRRRQPPRVSIHGAWQDAVERLSETGLRATPALTTADVIALAGGWPLTATALPSLGQLAAIADRARYAPEEPEPATPTTAWAINAAVRKAVRHKMPILRRLRALLDPRTLLAK